MSDSPSGGDGTAPVAGEPAGDAAAEPESRRWHVVEVGAGRPVVFVPDVFAPPDAFAAVVEDLAEDWRCAVVDLPGHGESSPVDPDVTLVQIADELADVCTELQTVPAAFVGHGVGASLVLLVAQRRPELVTAMTLVASDPATVPAPLVRIAADDTPDLVEEWLPGLCAPRFYTEQPGRAQEVRTHLEGFDTTGTVPLLRAVVDAEVVVANPAGVPVAVVGGQDDAMVPPERTRRIAADLGVDVTLVPACGHLLCVERPAALVDTIRGLLESGPVAGTSS